MRKYLILLIMIFSLTLSAGILEVLSFEQNITNFKGLSEAVEDENGEHCALIKIEHNHPGELFLEDTDVRKREQESPSCTYFYIPYSSEYIIIKASNIGDEEFLPCKYDFSENLKKEKTYILKLVSYSDEDKFGKKLIQIETIPEEAEVWIDGEKLAGRTPIKAYHNPGNYSIKIEREEYFGRESTINIRSKDNKFEFNLKPKYGTLNITTNPHAEMYLNGKLCTQREDIHLDPGKFTVLVEQKYHNSTSFSDTIETGDIYPLDIYPDPVCGKIIIDPEPDDAEIILIDEFGEVTNISGRQILEEMVMGNYSLEVKQEGYFSYTDNFFLEEDGVIKRVPRLKSAGIYFTLPIPSYAKEKLAVHAYKLIKNKKKDEISLETDGDHYFTGDHGAFNISLTHGEEEVFSKDIEISETYLPEIKLSILEFENPSKKCKLYRDSYFCERGSNTILVTEEKEAEVRVKIPGYLDMKRDFEFPYTDSLYTLKLGRDYFKWGFGLGLFPSKAKKFVGIKLPLVYSSGYYKMTGIELNVVNAGNYKKLEGSGSFTGIAIGGICAIGGKNLGGLSFGGIFTSAERDLNGVSIGGLVAQAGRNVNGLSIGGLFVSSVHNLNGISFGGGVVSGGHNVNGITLGGLVIGAENSINGIGASAFLKSSRNASGVIFSPINITRGRMSGLQIGLFNYAEELHGVQIGALNIIKDGEGGGVPLFPVLNIYF